jgi:hypothetical protein
MGKVLLATDISAEGSQRRRHPGALPGDHSDEAPLDV